MNYIFILSSQNYENTITKLILSACSIIMWTYLMTVIKAKSKKGRQLNVIITEYATIKQCNFNFHIYNQYEFIYMQWKEKCRELILHSMQKIIIYKKYLSK